MNTLEKLKVVLLVELGETNVLLFKFCLDTLVLLGELLVDTDRDCLDSKLCRIYRSLVLDLRH